jgi:6-phosphogluconolactonase
MTVSPITDEPEIAIRPDSEACAQTAAGMIAAALSEAVGDRERAHWATTGGSTPAAIYRHLAVSPLRDRVPWEFVELWLGDERFVPADHPLSNAKIAEDDLLEIGALSGQSGTGGSGADVLGGRTAGAPIPAENVHPIPTGQAIAEGVGPIWAAQRYAETLRDLGPAVDGRWPAFDLVLLGIGPDGHVLSVFPGSETFDKDDTVLGVPAPTHVEPHVARVTLNPRILDVARRIIVVAHGAGKAAILAEVLGPERDERRWPAQLARRAGATWILDEAAASALNR